LHAEVAEERKGPPRGVAACEVEVDGELPVSAQMPDAGRVEERGELGEAAATPPRRDCGELVAEIVADRQRRTPSSSSILRL
jgi:hypothetical protein